MPLSSPEPSSCHSRFRGVEKKKKGLTKPGEAPPQLGAVLFPVSTAERKWEEWRGKNSTLFRFGTQ